MNPLLARIMVAGAGLAAIAACSDAPPPQYLVSRDSLSYLHQAGARPVAVGAFDGRSLRDPFLLCLELAEVRDSDEFDYAGFVREALIAELRTAGLHTDDPAGTVLTGRIEWIEVDRPTPWDGRWTIQLTLASSNGATLSARERMKFEAGGMIGPSTCRAANRTLPVVVRQLLERMITSVEFRNLLAPAATA